MSAVVGGSATTLASSITYAPFGGMTGLTYGNSKVFTAVYDTNYRLTSRAVSSLYSYTYDTDNNGNITQKGTTTYGYDALNRLNGENSGSAVTYTYDANDNRLTKVAGSTTTTTVPSTSNKISAVGGASYTYDNAGNITADGTNTYVWNAAGQMKESKVGGSTVGAYTYDSQNRRTKKVAGSTVYYVYGAGGLLYGEYTSAGALVREYVYLGGAPLAQIDAGTPEVLTYIHTDHLGTPRFGTNTGGTQVWTWAGDAFGVGTPSGSRTVNLRMPGQYYDSESGLFYNWNRYYNPTIGRYVSVDPIGLDGGLNTFNYVEASPVMYTDPEGLYVQVIGAGVRACLANPVCRSIAVDIAKRTGQALADAAKAAADAWNGATPVPPVCPPVTQNPADETDKAGRKISEKAKNAKAPGACTPGQHDELQTQVHDICDQPRSCDPQGLSQDEIQARADIGVACAQARDNINNICFYGGDKVHRDLAIDAWNTAAKCQGKLL